MSFNQCAWKLFYQIVKHHNGIIEELINNKTLGQFLDLIVASASNTVIANGLHYLSKLFRLASKTERERSQQKEYEVKSIEKDVKTLVTFLIQRHQFIKIHMTYKKIVSSSTQGIAFKELANFYHILSTKPLCQKLLKEIKKYPEYKEGLKKLSSMFHSNTKEIY